MQESPYRTQKGLEVAAKSHQEFMMADGEVAKGGDVALTPDKFKHPDFTASGAARAHV